MTEPYAPMQPLLAAGAHEYLSTACLHGYHGYCQAKQGEDGDPKVPARCKWCDARCRCVCHPHPQAWMSATAAAGPPPVHPAPPPYYPPGARAAGGPPPPADACAGC